MVYGPYCLIRKGRAAEQQRCGSRTGRLEVIKRGAGHFQRMHKRLQNIIGGAAAEAAPPLTSTSGGAGQGFWIRDLGAPTISERPAGSQGSLRGTVQDEPATTGSVAWATKTV